MRSRVFVVAAAAVIAAGGYWYWAATRADAGRTPAAAVAAVPVVVTPVTIRSVPERFTTIGTSLSLAVVGIKARTDSIVETQNFVEGQEVKAGDLLFTLDDRMLRAQLSQSEANLERDTAQLEKAKGDVQRYTELVRRDAVARQQYDAAVSSAAALEATVKADRAAIESANVAVGYTRLVAPVDGRTGTVAARPGTTVRAADTTPLVTITQLRPIHVAFNVPERYLTALRNAMAAGPVGVEASLPSDKNAPSTGNLVFIDSAVDTRSGTILAKAEFANADTRLWPGQFVDVSVVLRVDTDAVTIPAEAVQIGQDGNFVFVVSSPDAPDKQNADKQNADKQIAEMRKVTVRRIDQGLAVIADGLKADENVVVDGQSRLLPGSRVSLRAPTPNTADPAAGKRGPGAGT